MSLVASLQNAWSMEGGAVVLYGTNQGAIVLIDNRYNVTYHIVPLPLEGTGILDTLLNTHLHMKHGHILKGEDKV